MRKLATIRKVKRLMPIPKADFIELAQVDDWQVIVKKGEFTEGSKCIFFEIDSLLPDELRYSFLGVPKDHNGFQKHRLKTMKMRGVISQGLALPFSSFPEVHSGFSIGDDITDLLKVTKYEPDVNNHVYSGNAQGKFPSFIPKTDQERIQNLPMYYEQYKDHLWEETLKLDGSSLTCYKINKPLNLLQKVVNLFYRIAGAPRVEAHHFGVCSRNLELKRGDGQSDFWKIVIDQEIEKWLPVGYAIQGELIGPKIQANHERVEKNDFYVFDIYSIEDGRYLLPEERMDFFTDYFKFAKCDIKHVPILISGTPIFTECQDFSLLQQRVTGSSINSGTVSEGRVYKSLTVPGLSFKCISNEYLLKSEV